jgi:hypothetical protein
VCEGVSVSEREREREMEGTRQKAKRRTNEGPLSLNVLSVKLGQDFMFHCLATNYKQPHLLVETSSDGSKVDLGIRPVASNGRDAEAHLTRGVLVVGDELHVCTLALGNRLALCVVECALDICLLRECDARKNEVRTPKKTKKLWAQTLE